MRGLLDVAWDEIIHVLASIPLLLIAWCGFVGTSFLLLAGVATVVAVRAARQRRREVTSTKSDSRAAAAVRKTDKFKDLETAVWLNSLVAKVWPSYRVQWQQLIADGLQKALLKSKLPPGVSSIKLLYVDLGSAPPQIEAVRAFPKSHDMAVVDITVSYKQ